MKKLYLVTKTFPLGAEERSFLQYEVECLQKNFDLTIVTTEIDAGKNMHHSVCDQYDVISVNPHTGAFGKIVSALTFLTRKEAWEEFADIIHEGKLIGKRLYRAFMFGTAAETFWRKLIKICNIQRSIDAVFYFYWWDYKCLGVTMHKKKYPFMRVVARTHGYDLYNERELYGKQFYKRQMERNLERIFFISEYGRNYYEKYIGKKDDRKHILSRLGVKKQTVQSGPENNYFLLVSCSNVIPLKRIELIVQGLSLISDKVIKWVHFGDGSEFEEIKKLSEKLLLPKDNISYEFVGRVANQDVINFYKTSLVDCFITTSSTEGNPVSVQEALSFGIPIIGTEVSDIPLMIRENGVLLSSNPAPEEVAEAICSVAMTSPEQRKLMRENSYNIWKKDYDAEKNYAAFINLLLEL